MNRGKKIGLYILGFLLCTNIIAWLGIFEISKPKTLEIWFFDVGQGDAIFIQTPQKHQILIDGGPDAQILEKLSLVMPFYDKSIDLIILSHPESDHMAGLIKALKAYKIDYILWTGIVRDTAEFKQWQKAIKQEIEQGAQIKIAQAGQKIISSRTVLEVLHPFESLESQKFKDSNNTSIVVKLISNNKSILFTGDIYKSIEKQLIQNNADLDANVLKVAHHGSKTSTSNEFIQAVSPDTAIIQLGQNNSYGHPHKQTLETLLNNNVEILRTDELGDIKYEITKTKNISAY